VLLKRFRVFKDAPSSADYLHSNFNVKKKEGWNILAGHKNIQENDVKKYIIPIDYRPFDKRYIFYEDKIIWRSVKKIMQHYVHGNNYGLMVCRQQKTNGFYHCLVHTNIVESSFVSNKTSEIGYSFPLYLYPEDNALDSAAQRSPNLNKTIVDEITAKTGLRFTGEKEDAENTFSPLDLLDYIYAVLYSNNYRTKYKEFLKIDFPRVPYPVNAERFYKLASIGSILRNLHLMENVSPAMDIASFPVAGSNEIDTARYKDSKVFINKSQYFLDVPPEAWNYYIGGYQPAQKWLKDRKGRVLSFDDIEHYRKIVFVLTKTIEIQQQIDEVLL
jgi:predicted helicase